MQSRRTTDPATAGDLGALDAGAIARVREEEGPEPRDADELHDALLSTGFLTAAEMAGVGAQLIDELTAARRAARVTFGSRPKRGSHPGSGLRAAASLTATGSSRPAPRR